MARRHFLTLQIVVDDGRETLDVQRLVEDELDAWGQYRECNDCLGDGRRDDGVECASCNGDGIIAHWGRVFAVHGTTLEVGGTQTVAWSTVAGPMAGGEVEWMHGRTRILGEALDQRASS